MIIIFQAVSSQEGGIMIQMRVFSSTIHADYLLFILLRLFRSCQTVSTLLLGRKI